MKKYIASTLFLLMFAVVSFTTTANIALAQTSECDTLRDKFNHVGTDGSKLIDSLPVYCTEGEAFVKVTTLLYGLVGVVAVFSIIYGGYLYMTAGSNEAAAKKGRQIMTYTAIGILIVLTATLVITIVSRFVVDNKLF